MLTSCANNAPAQTTPSETENLTETTAAVTQPEPLLPTEKTFFPYGTIVKHIGRTLIENDTLWLAHSASGIEFSFRGSKASMVIVGDNTVYGDENSQARFAVYVNGDRTLDEMVTEEEKSYEIFSSDVSEDVTIRVVKLSESGNSAFGIKDITVVSEGAVLSELSVLSDVPDGSVAAELLMLVSFIVVELESVDLYGVSFIDTEFFKLFKSTDILHKVLEEHKSLLGI